MTNIKNKVALVTGSNFSANDLVAAGLLCVDITPKSEPEALHRRESQAAKAAYFAYT